MEHLAFVLACGHLYSNRAAIVDTNLEKLVTFVKCAESEDSDDRFLQSALKVPM